MRRDEDEDEETFQKTTGILKGCNELPFRYHPCSHIFKLRDVCKYLDTHEEDMGHTCCEGAVNYSGAPGSCCCPKSLKRNINNILKILQTVHEKFTIFSGIT